MAPAERPVDGGGPPEEWCWAGDDLRIEIRLTDAETGQAVVDLVALRYQILARAAGGLVGAPLVTLDIGEGVSHLGAGIWRIAVPRIATASLDGVYIHAAKARHAEHGDDTLFERELRLRRKRVEMATS